jgi:hypothetical protein
MLFVIPSKTTWPYDFACIYFSRIRLYGPSKELHEVHGDHHRFLLFYLFTLPFIAKHASSKTKHRINKPVAAESWNHLQYRLHAFPSRGKSYCTAVIFGWLFPLERPCSPNRLPFGLKCNLLVFFLFLGIKPVVRNFFIILYIVVVRGTLGAGNFPLNIRSHFSMAPTRYD